MPYKIIRKQGDNIQTETIKRKELSALLSSVTANRTHVCWDKCPGALCNASTCPKLYDLDEIEGKNIEKYDFINEGFEVRNPAGQLYSLIVTDCGLYNKYIAEHQNEEQAKVKVKK